MKIDRLNESELREILKTAQEGERKLKEMSDCATIMAEKWRGKTAKFQHNTSDNDTVQS